MQGNDLVLSKMRRIFSLKVHVPIYMSNLFWFTQLVYVIKNAFYFKELFKTAADILKKKQVKSFFYIMYIGLTPYLYPC